MNPDAEKTLIFDADHVNSFIQNISSSIRLEFQDDKICDIAFIGIQQGGVPLAKRISRILKENCPCEPPIGTLDITMYRDDIGMRKILPPINETLIPFDINGKVIILADDVLQTGRSIRAALDALTDYGRPAMIRLAVLLDRGYREFPIRADYIGENISIPRNQRVKIYWSEYTGTDAVYSMPRIKT